MRFNTRLFVVLWVTGLVGVLSLLLIDVGSLLRILPLPPGTEIPMSIPALKALSLVPGIVISSLVFALGHFPVALMLFPSPFPALILFVLLGNSAFGLVGGYLYWTRGLESAMIAHATTHVVMFSASYFGAYF